MSLFSHTVTWMSRIETSCIWLLQSTWFGDISYHIAFDYFDHGNTQMSRSALHLIPSIMILRRCLELHLICFLWSWYFAGFSNYIAFHYFNHEIKRMSRITLRLITYFMILLRCLELYYISILSCHRNLILECLGSSEGIFDKKLFAEMLHLTAPIVFM